VYVHIGPPKTGTTYLQDILWRNRKRLAAHDVTFLGPRKVDHFHAALDLRGISFGGFDNPQTAGAWPALAQRALKAPTSRCVISHEVFAGAADEQIERLVGDLSGADVHVVYGARDLARQLPALWQESLKNRRTKPYEAFLRRALRDNPRSEGSGFWKAQDAVATLGRWAEWVPATRIHVMILPAAGAPPDALWKRLCRVIGIDPDGYDLDVSRANPSLTLADAEMLRRLNGLLPDDLPWPVYERQVKRRFNRRADTRRPGDRLRLPPEHRSRVLELAEASRAGLAASGYDIVGDLDDLIPADSGFGTLAPVPPETVTDAAVEMLAEVLTEERGRDRLPPRATARSILDHLRRGKGPT
jgi:hypothetical protein